MVEPVRLRPPASTADKDARRLDDMVGHAIREQETMQPEAVPTRLEAGDYLDLGAEPGFRPLALLGDEGKQPPRVAGIQPVESNLLGARLTQGGKPGQAAQLKRKINSPGDRGDVRHRRLHQRQGEPP